MLLYVALNFFICEVFTLENGWAIPFAFLSGYGWRSTAGSEFAAVQRQDIRGTRIVRVFHQFHSRGNKLMGLTAISIRDCRNEDLLKGIYNMGFSKPSKIQERALPLLLKDPCAHRNLRSPRESKCSLALNT